mmetsp:Transcript_13124/g.11601  ORF Transcript_13124/g.11601 Transcript_13124/m.11601 type:complete len:243 (-) Transcript_13124:79-807(-)
MTFETSANVQGSPDGTVVVSYKDKNIGSMKAELGTGGKASGKVSFNKLMDPLTVTISGKGDPSGALAAEWKQDFISGDVKVEHKGTGASTLTGSAAIGTDGLSVGGEVVVGRNAKGESSISGYNVGTQYVGADYVAAIKTKDKSETVNVSYHHKVSADHQVGAQFEYDTNAETRELTLGMKYSLDSDTTLKVLGKTSGQVWMGLQHKLAAPRMNIGLAAQFNAASYKFNADKFGVNLSFGDF